MYKAIAILVLTLVLGAAMVMALGITGGGAASGAGRADIVLINRGDVNTLDVQRMSWLQDFRVASALYEGLLSADRFGSSFELRPALAESWRVSADGLTYVFKLRSTAKWSNGEAVTAEHLRLSWRRAMLPDIVGDYATLFRLIDGAAAFYTWREEQLKAFAAAGGGPRFAEASALWQETVRRYDETVGVRAIDALTLEVKLRRPVAYFLELMAFEAFFPIYTPAAEPYEQPDATSGRISFSTAWTRPPQLISNGRFKLEKWRFRRDMLLVANPHYWNQSDIHARSILLPSVNDPNAQVMAYTTGTVDWLTDVVPDYRAEMIAAKRQFYRENLEAYRTLLQQGLDPVEIDRHLPPDPRAHIHVFPTFGTYWYNINCQPLLPDGTPNAMVDRRVRQALALAIDKKYIVEQIRRSGESIASTMVPPGSLGTYDTKATVRGLGSDVARARQLLVEAGYPGGAGLPVLEILFNRDGGHDLIAQAVSRDWQENLGVSVRLVQKDTKIVGKDLQNKNYVISRAGWFGDYGDPTTFLDLNRSDDNNNDRGYNSPEFDALMHAADAELNVEARMALLAQAEKLIVEVDLPLIPIFHYTSTMLFDAHKVSGVSPHPRQRQDFGLLGRIEGPKGDGVRALTPRSVLPNAAAPALRSAITLDATELLPHALPGTKP